MLTTLCLLSLAAVPPAPPTPKKPVKDVYFGQTVVDDYRWLEAGDDPAVKKWSDAQNAHARALLDAMPGRTALKKRLTELMADPAPTRYLDVFVGGQLFAWENRPPQPQMVLVAIDGFQTEVKERVVFDPAVFDPTGATSFDFVKPSLDGKRVVLSLSKGGSELGDGHLFDTATGAELKSETIPGINGGAAGGSVAWTTDGFFYTRMPRGEERPPEDRASYQQVWFHKLGTDPSKDTPALTDALERISESALSSSEDGAWVADLVQRGDSRRFSLFLRSTGAFTKLADVEDQISAVSFGRDGALYLLSLKDSPNGKVLRLPLSTKTPPSLANAKVVVPESDPIEEFAAGEHRLHLIVQKRGFTRVREVNTDGSGARELDTPAMATVLGQVRLGGDDLLVTVSGLVMPDAVYRSNAKAGTFTPTAMVTKVAADLSGYEVIRDDCTSKDGTSVPLTLVKRKDARLDGRNPTLLTGYGGFGISYNLGYEPTVPALLEQGGVFAIASMRGGREFGEAGHLAAMKTHKQNVFDDFIACAQRLVAMKVTSPDKLAIEGESNGGLLMGAVMTQQPKAFKAVVAQVGIYDMLRNELTPNGQFNIAEYGSVKNEDEFKALAAYSPLHAVKKGVQYPALLMMTGANDPRVDPFHSRKFTAALQASGSKQVILLRTSGDTGHGYGTPLAERIDERVDFYGFVLQQLGVNVKPVPVVTPVAK